MTASGTASSSSAPEALSLSMGSSYG